jgi:hypothetical protein
VSDDFVAAAGFVPRVDYRKPQLRYFLDYQPKKYPWIRRFSPHVTWNAFYGFDGDRDLARPLAFLRDTAGGGGRRPPDRQEGPSFHFVIYNADGTGWRSRRAHGTVWRTTSKPERGSSNAVHLGRVLQRRPQRLTSRRTSSRGRFREASDGAGTSPSHRDFVLDLIPVKVNYPSRPDEHLRADPATARPRTCSNIRLRS